MKYGWSPNAVNPVLHVYERHVDHRYVGTGRIRVYSVWRCGAGGWDAQFTDEPNDVRPCLRCEIADEHPFDRVYFAERDGLIKIGKSSQPNARVLTLKARLLATIPGDGRTEVALHLAFAHLCVKGEWFRPAPELLALIERVKRPTDAEAAA